MPLWAHALAATLIVQVVSSFAGAAVPLLGPPLMERAGLPPESIGLVSAMSAAGICWFLACGGPLLAHHGAIRTLQFGLACVAAGLFLLSQPLGLLGLLGALAIGFGIAPNTPAGSQILSRATPPRHRTLIFSIKQAGVPLGGVLAGLIVAPLALAHGLPATLGAIIALALAAILAAQAFRRRLDTPERSPRPGWARALLSPAVMARGIASLRSHPALPLLTALGASFSIAQACLGAFMATWVVTRHDASLAEAGRVVATMQAASMLGRIALGWLADRLRSTLTLLALQALATALALVLLITLAGDSRALLYACAALAGLTAFGWNGLHMAELARIAPPQLVGEVTSAANLFGFLGSIGGPLAFALVVGWTGSYTLAFLLAAAQVALLGLVCLAAARRA
jgi:MFS family permease